MPHRKGSGHRPPDLRSAIGAAFLLGTLLASGAADTHLRDDVAAIRSLQSRARWAAAESLATSVLHRLETKHSPDSLGIADVLGLIVQSKQRRGAARDSLAPGQARRVLGIRTRHVAPEDPRIAEAHHALAALFGSRGEPDSAYPHALRAYEIRNRSLALDDTLIAETLRLLGTLSRERSDFAASADFLERAFQQRLRVHDENRRIMATLLFERGFALRRIGEIDQGRAATLRSLAIHERIGGPNDPELAVSLDGLAALERQSGNLALSIEIWEKALGIARSHYPNGDARVVRIQRNSNGALVELGDYAASARLMESVVRAYEKIYGPDNPRTLSARTSLGIAWVGIGDSLRAMRQLRSVEAALADKPGPADPMLGLSLKFQVALLQARGNHAEALALCRRAIPMLRSNATAQWQNLTELHIGAVRSHVALGDTAGLEGDRLELLRTAGQRALNTTNILQNTRMANALALSTLGHDAEAWEEALAADRIARERLKANVRSLPERRSLQLSLQLSPSTDLVIDLARRGSNDQRERAWDALVRVRGLVHAEIERRRLPAAAIGDTALAGRHARWVAAQRRYAQRLVSSLNDDELPAGPPIEDLRISAEAAERDLARALAERGRAPQRTEVGLADVRTRLAPGQALVGFVETEANTDTARVTALITRANSDRIGWVELGRSALLMADIAAWQEQLAASPGRDRRNAAAASRAERQTGRVVRGRTWDRIAPELGTVSDVVIVPDGPLIGMSWHALPEGRHAYLVESGPTLHVLNAERERIDDANPAVAGSLLAVGAPDFGSRAGPSMTVPVHLAAAADPRAGVLPEFVPLPATAVEVREVASTWSGPTEVLSGAAATEEAFKARAPGHQVLHLATHGLAARDTFLASSTELRGVGGVSPLSAGASPASAPPASRPAAMSPWLGRRVWLALAGANRAAEHTTDENEGLLTAEEVLTLDLSGTEWVVLSACRSGAGESWSREGALGMRRAFHLAGARTVIASQWSVDDEATREWMQELYAARTLGARTGGAAIRLACREALANRRAERRSTHPFYWAAFDATGE